MHRSLVHILAIALFTAGCTAEWIIPEGCYVKCESNALLDFIEMVGS